MYVEARHENQLHHEAAVAEEAEAGTGADRAAGEATVAAVRTVGLAGTKAALYLWLMDNGIPMGCRCFVCPQRRGGGNDFVGCDVLQNLSSSAIVGPAEAGRKQAKDPCIPRQFLFASAHDKVSRA